MQLIKYFFIIVSYTGDDIKSKAFIFYEINIVTVIIETAYRYAVLSEYSARADFLSF